MAFTFQAYRNPYVSTIADLLSRGEDAKAKALIDVANAQARAAEARGQAYGGAIESVGKIVSGIPAQMQANKDQAFQAAQRARLLQQQKLDAAARDRQEEARVNADRFRANPSVTTVVPGQAGSLPDRMLPSFSPETFVPDGAATSPDTLGGMLRKANVFGQEPASSRLADTIPSASMTGAATVAPRLAATMTGPDTTKTTNTSKRRDENGLELWDVEGYKQQQAALGLGAEAQTTVASMTESNNEMLKHHASAVALSKADAGRASRLPDPLIAAAVKQLLVSYRKNGVLPPDQLDAVEQQVNAIDQLPQEQQTVAYRKFLQSVSDVPVAEDFTLGEGGKRYSGTGTLIADNPKAIKDPELYQVTVAGPDGKPMTRLATEAEVRAGIAVYREPKIPSAGNLRFLTGPNGDVIEWPTTTPAPKGYKPYDAVAERGSGAQKVESGPVLLRAALSSLKEIDGGLTQQSGVTGILAGAGQSIMGAANLDVVPGVYNGLAAAIPIRLAKASGEQGNLALGEQEVWRPIAPKASDPYNIRQAKYAAIEAFVTAVESGKQTRDASGVIVSNSRLADNLLTTLTRLNGGAVAPNAAITAPPPVVDFGGSGRPAVVIGPTQGSEFVIRGARPSGGR